MVSSWLVMRYEVVSPSEVLDSTGSYMAMILFPGLGAGVV